MHTSTLNTPILSSTQYNSFCKEGYLRLPEMIPALLLKRLRELFDELMYSSGDTDDKVVFNIKDKEYVTNLENVCNKGNLACLELLGYYPILSLAETICGPDFFLIQEFAVNKNRGDELPVLWHLDMAHQRSGNCFTMGIYLDDAEQGDGALKVVPGSHLDNRTICELSKEPHIEVPMKAGDVLIHDMMLAHSSDPIRTNPLRRVVYFEFLSAAHVSVENIYSDELVQRRTRLQFAASRHYKSLHPDKQQFVHPIENEPAEDETKTIEEILTEIYSMPINARPSAYCFENVAIFSGKE